MKQMKNPPLCLKLLFDSEHKLNCHIFTSNKAILSLDEYFFKKKYSTCKQTKLRNTLETLSHSHSLLTARSAIIIDIYRMQVDLDSSIEACVHVH